MSKSLFCDNNGHFKFCVPLPENKENFLYNQLISENIEGVVFYEIFLKSGF